MSTINLEHEIIRENEATLAAEQTHLDAQAKLDAEVDKVLAAADEKYREGLMEELGFDYKHEEAVRIRKEREALGNFPSNRIMSKDAIRATCVKYGLRFLPTRFYKGQLDQGIGPAMEAFRIYCNGEFPKIEASEMLEENNGTFFGFRTTSTIKGANKAQFYIAAPATEFVLQPKPQDPLLFARLTIDKFFLIHKWGDDLKTGDSRKGFTDQTNWNSQYSDGLTESQRIARAQFNNAGNMSLSNDTMAAQQGQAISLQSLLGRMQGAIRG